MLADPCTSTALVLHGRQVPRLLHNHHRLLARTNRRRLRRLLDRSLPANRRKGQTNGRLLVPEEVD